MHTPMRVENTYNMSLQNIHLLECSAASGHEITVAVGYFIFASVIFCEREVLGFGCPWQAKEQVEKSEMSNNYTASQYVAVTFFGYLVGKLIHNREKQPKFH